MAVISFSDFINSDKNAKNNDCAVVIQNILKHIQKQKEPCTLKLPENGEIHIYKDFCPVREYHTSNTDSVQFPKKVFGILIEDIDNLTVEGNGCRFIFHGDMSALGVVRCKNIAIKNFSWDFANPTTSQVTVREVGAGYTVLEAAKGCDFEIRHGKVQWICGKSPYTGKPYYTQYNAHKSYCTVGFDPETKIQRRYNITQSPFSRAIICKKIGDRKIKVRYFGNAPKPWQKIGMVAQMCASRQRPTAGAFLWESENITVDSVSPHYLHGFGWLTQMCKDVSFKNCRFVPNADGRLCTSYADLIHVSGAGGKIEIENCEFSHAHDDPINIHGTFTRVESRVDKTTLRLRYVHKQQGGFPQFHIGDQVIFYARNTLTPLGGREEIFTVTKAGVPGADGNNMKTMTVSFDKPLPQEICDKIGSEPKYVAENITYTPEVSVRGCTFDSIPTRGILCTTRKKVLIENNRFDHMAMACIFISNDSNEWYESGPVRDMTIRHNEFFIRETGQKEWADAPAVYVHPVVKGGRLPETPVHKNITVENNTVHLYHDRAFVIESVENLTIQNNNIIRESNKAGSVCAVSACKNVNCDVQE